METAKTIATVERERERERESYTLTNESAVLLNTLTNTHSLINKIIYKSKDSSIMPNYIG